MSDARRSETMFLSMKRSFAVLFLLWTTQSTLLLQPSSSSSPLSSASFFARAQGGTEFPAKPCKTNGVNKDTTKADCLRICEKEDRMQWVDYAIGPTSDDPNIYRFTSCNCTHVPDFFRCVDQETVFTYEGAVDDCADLNITSVGKCQSFCQAWGDNPIAAQIDTQQRVACQCAGVQLCGSASGIALVVVWSLVGVVTLLLSSSAIM